MVTRWSRLALAALLACGVSPGLAVADAGDAARDPSLACPCNHDGVVGPTLVAELDDVERGHGRRQAPPLCALTPLAVSVARVAIVVEDELPVAGAEPASREAPWRLAPKTSPPLV